MSLRLILMRHAKSDWANPVLKDFERPLNGRGRRAGRAIGMWLARNQINPDVVLCSSAVRTRETLSLVGDSFASRPKIEFLKSLYLAPPETMLTELSKITSAKTVLLLAHNPGCATLAEALADVAPPHPKFHNYPSAATCVFNFDAEDWALILPGAGKVVEFIVPRDLE